MYSVFASTMKSADTNSALMVSVCVCDIASYYMNVSYEKLSSLSKASTVYLTLLN